MTQGPKDSVAPCSNVLFVCSGNSCRSQMAEALANRLGQGRVHAWSAGSRPAGAISAVAQEVMRDAGLSMDGQWSKGLEEVPVAETDVLVTMGCEVECPMPKGFTGRLVEWNIPDPGDDLQLGREVRDLIERQVRALLAELYAGSHPEGPSSGGPPA
jgi:arsenate reductase (thioredoxin)